jgi:hypothetical protein
MKLGDSKCIYKILYKNFSNNLGQGKKLFQVPGPPGSQTS